MKLAVLLVQGKKDNKINTTIQLETNMSGGRETQFYEPKELLDYIDFLIENDFVITSNEPLILEASMRHEVKENFTKKRLEYMVEILDWWGEING